MNDSLVENRLHDISASIPGLIYQFRLTPDHHMHFTYISEGSVALLGLTPEEVYRDIKIAFRNINRDDLPGVLESIQTSARRLEQFKYEFRIDHKNGFARWISATANPHTTDDGSTVWNGIMMDITATKLAANKATLIRRAVEKAVEGIIITDVNLPDNPVIFANRAFYEMTGYKPHEVIGKNCRFLQGKDTDPDTISTIKKKVAAQQAFTTELLNYKKDGTPFWNSLTMIPMLDSFGVLTNFAGFQNDVTERKSAEAKMQLAQEELESFSYTVSHDLQGPLRIMSAFSKILKNEYTAELNPTANEYLGFIENSAMQMSNLIKGLLAFSKLGRAALNFDACDQEDLVRTVIDQCKLSALSSPAEFIILPLDKAVCDADLIRQVWSNLIGNALKYSSKKEVPIVEIGQLKTGGDTIYYVKDNGDGFDPGKSSKLFRPFQRMHSTEEFEGTGIGLATVHKIISKHGGRIWAEAKKGEGATFFFTLQDMSAS